jgi:hypothetical protein
MASRLFNPTYRFRGIDAPNVAGSTNLILNALGTPGRLARGLQEKEKAKREEERANQLLQLKLNQDARLQDRANREADLYKQREALGNILTSLPSKEKTVTKTIPAVEGNRAIIEAREKANERIEERNKKVLEDQIRASEEYSSLLDQYRNETLPVGKSVMRPTAPDGSKLLRKTTVNQKGVEDPKGRYVGYADSSGKEVSGFERLLGNYTTVPSELSEEEKSLYYSTSEKDRLFTDREAHNKAMKESGLNELKKLLPKNKIPELIPDTPSKTIEILEDKRKGKWIDEAYKSILNNPRADDNTKLLAIGKLQNQANLLFGKDPRPLTPSESLAQQKAIEKKEKEELELSDYYSLGVPRNIKTTKGAKEYLKDRKKISDSKYGVGPKTLKAYESGLGTLDDDDQKAIESVAERYKITDSDLASIIDTYATQDITPRFSGAITEDVIKFIADNYKSR